MARVIVTGAHNFGAIANLAGKGLANVVFHDATDELEVHGVSQAVLDAAFADYTANQVARDAEYQVVLETEATGQVIQNYNNDRSDRAIVDALREELNVLRASIPLPDISAGQMDGKVRQKIANP